MTGEMKEMKSFWYTYTTTCTSSVVVIILIILIHLTQFISCANVSSDDNSQDTIDKEELVYKSFILNSLKGKYLDFQIEEVDHFEQKVRLIRDRIDFTSKYEQVTISERVSGQTSTSTTTHTSHVFSFADKNLFVTIQDEDRTCKVDNSNMQPLFQYGKSWLHPEWLPLNDLHYVGPFLILLILELQPAGSVHGRRLVQSNDDNNRRQPVYEFTFAPNSKWKYVYQFVEDDHDDKVIQQVRLFSVEHDQSILFHTFNFFGWNVFRTGQRQDKWTSMPIGYGCDFKPDDEKQVRKLLTDYGKESTICFDYVYNQDQTSFDFNSFVNSKSQRQSVCIGFDRNHEYVVSDTRQSSGGVEVNEKIELFDLKTGDTFQLDQSSFANRHDYRHHHIDDPINQFDLSNPISVYLHFPQVFHMPHQAKYLGTRNVRGRECDVYEHSVNRRNSASNRKMSTFIITHYYAKTSRLASPLYSVPLQIQVDQFDMRYRNLRQGHVMIQMIDHDTHVHDDLWDKIDFDRCWDDVDCTWFTVRYVMTHEQVKVMQIHSNIFKREFRKTLAISAVRLNKLNIRFNANEIDVQVKLSPPVHPSTYFDIQKSSRLITSNQELITNSLNHCLRTCLQVEINCIAVTFSSSQEICQLLMDERQAKLAKKTSEYRLDVRTRKDKEWFSTYTRKHFESIDTSIFDNRLFLQELKQKIANGNFYFFMFSSIDSMEEPRPTQLVLSSPNGHQNELDERRKFLDTKSFRRQFVDAKLEDTSINSNELVAISGNRLSPIECEHLCRHSLNCFYFSYCSDEASTTTTTTTTLTKCVLLEESDTEKVNKLLKTPAIGCNIYRSE